MACDRIGLRRYKVDASSEQLGADQEGAPGSSSPRSLAIVGRVMLHGATRVRLPLPCHCPATASPLPSILLPPPFTAVLLQVISLRSPLYVFNATESLVQLSSEGPHGRAGRVGQVLQKRVRFHCLSLVFLPHKARRLHCLSLVLPPSKARACPRPRPDRRDGRDVRAVALGGDQLGLGAAVGALQVRLRGKAGFLVPKHCLTSLKHCLSLHSSWAEVQLKGRARKGKDGKDIKSSSVWCEQIKAGLAYAAKLISYQVSFDETEDTMSMRIASPLVVQVPCSCNPYGESLLQL